MKRMIQAAIRDELKRRKNRVLKTPETLGTKPIFLATLYSTNPLKDYPRETSKGRRKFVWLEDSGKVSILMFCESGYYYETVVMPADEAREFWKCHVDNGWICKVKKTEKLRGHHVRAESMRLLQDAKI